MCQKLTLLLKISRIQLAASFLVVLAGIVSIGSKAATQSVDLQENFDINFKKWASKKIKNYHFTFGRSCFCPVEYSGPVVIIVRNGAIIAIRYKNSGEPVNKSSFKYFPTINQLFDQIQHRIDRKPYRLEVEYDSELGYPRFEFFDGDKNIADDEGSSGVRNLIVDENRPGGEVKENPRLAPGPTLVKLPVQCDNPPNASLVVTEAYLDVGEPQEISLKGMSGDGKSVLLIDKGEKARRVKFTYKLVNQSDHLMARFILKIQNPAFLADESILISTGLAFPAEILLPKSSHSFESYLPFSDRKNGLELMNHLSGFRLSVFEAIRPNGEAHDSNIYGPVEDLIFAYNCKDPRIFEIVKKKPVPDEGMQADRKKVIRKVAEILESSPKLKCPTPTNDADESYTAESKWLDYPDEYKTILPVSDTLRPTIHYSEKAQYTPEARANKVQGTIVLNAVFTADGKIESIEVARGLPYGLTANAISAAKEIRFRPATKNGLPVSVRGRLEFDFALEWIQLKQAPHE